MNYVLHLIEKVMNDEIKKRPIYRDPSSAGPDRLPPFDSGLKQNNQHSLHDRISAANKSAAKESWMQRLVAAKTKWKKLTEVELSKTEGNRNKLIDLVRQRYAISQQDAEEQVLNFFSKNETSFTLTA